MTFVNVEKPSLPEAETGVSGSDRAEHGPGLTPPRKIRLPADGERDYEG
jgi:hypothetical protein